MQLASRLTVKKKEHQSLLARIRNVNQNTNPEGVEKLGFNDTILQFKTRMD